jgi:HEAT repeat protein
VGQTLIVRVVLADDLRRHAPALCNTAVPALLRSDNPEQVLATLDILAAWERAVALPQIAALVEHRDRRIQIKALRVLPLTPAARENAEVVNRALSSQDESVSVAAAVAAGRMKLESAMVPLARCLRSGRPELARAAAAALAGLHPRGWQTLEELTNYSDPVTASAALEALEHARKSFMGN